MMLLRLRSGSVNGAALTCTRELRNTVLRRSSVTTTGCADGAEVRPSKLLSAGEDWRAGRVYAESLSQAFEQGLVPPCRLGVPDRALLALWTLTVETRLLRFAPILVTSMRTFTPAELIAIVCSIVVPPPRAELEEVVGYLFTQWRGIRRSRFRSLWVCEDDLLQDALLKLAESLSRGMLRNPEKVEAFARKVFVCKALDAIRRRRIELGLPVTRVPRDSAKPAGPGSKGKTVKRAAAEAAPQPTVVPKPTSPGRMERENAQESHEVRIIEFEAERERLRHGLSILDQRRRFLDLCKQVLRTYVERITPEMRRAVAQFSFLDEMGDEDIVRALDLWAAGQDPTNKVSMHKARARKDLVGFGLSLSVLDTILAESKRTAEAFEILRSERSATLQGSKGRSDK